jgi:hypothetical protein
MMMTVILFVAYVMLGAAAWIFRGGGFWSTGSTQFARAGGAAAMILPLYLYFGGVWLILLIPTLWAGLALVGWGDFFDMGRNLPGTAKSEELVSPLLSWMDPASITHDLLGMSLSGLVVMLPSVILMSVMGVAWWSLLIPGLLLGPIYWLGWAISEKHAISVSEGLAGGIISFFLVLALVV